MTQERRWSGSESRGWSRSMYLREPMICWMRTCDLESFCGRSAGSYHLMGFRIADVPLSVRAGDPDAKNVDRATFAKREKDVG